MLPDSDPLRWEERAVWRAHVADTDKVAEAARALIAGDPGPILESVRAAGYAAPSIEIDPPPETLDLPPLAALHAFWHARRGRDGAPPPADAIDATELRGALGYVHLLERVEDGYDFVYRVYGSIVSVHASNDWTGWTIGAMALKTETGLGLMFRAVQTACGLARAPIATLHHSPPWLAAKAWRRLTVPFLTGSGECARFLVATVPVGFRRPTLDDKATISRLTSPGLPNER